MEELIFSFINNFIEQNITIVYCIFFISSVLQLVFPPFPSDVVLIFQGYLTAVSSSFYFIKVLIIALSGTFTGSFIVYQFGYHKGCMVFNYSIVNRFISEKHKKKAEKLFHKYGSYAIAISKFIPGINAVLLMFAGIFKVKAKVVYISVFFSNLFHHIIILLLGRFLGENLEDVKKILYTYNTVVFIIIFIIAVIGFIIYKFISKRKLGIEEK